MKGNQDYKFHQHPKYLYTAMYSEMWIGEGGSVGAVARWFVVCCSVSEQMFTHKIILKGSIL